MDHILFPLSGGDSVFEVSFPTLTVAAVAPLFAAEDICATSILALSCIEAPS